MRRDIVLTWSQTKQTLTLPRVRVNSVETWQHSASLPCKVCGEVGEEEEEEGEGVYGQIDGDSGGGKLEELSPVFTKLKGRLDISNRNSLSARLRSDRAGRAAGVILGVAWRGKNRQ